jgi:hypothetical protein
LLLSFKEDRMKRLLSMAFAALLCAGVAVAGLAGCAEAGKVPAVPAVPAVPEAPKPGEITFKCAMPGCTKTKPATQADPLPSC